ncbi:NADase-type glycan-binding domain-containing protein [Blastococcus montanus]|uniref:NADase-type glycan-binding domain-containing protein n=1 Tax=Blastococcus montanus TaxID=3144973 RepID=UPI003208E2C2
MTGVLSTVLGSLLLLVLAPRVEEALREPTCDDPRGLELVRPLEVTSTHPELAPQGQQSYELARMLDGDSGTAWVEGVLDEDNPYGRGVSLEFRFPDETDLRLACVVNGYGRSWETYQENARLRLLDVETQQGDSEEVGLPEKTPDTFAVHQELAVPEGTTTFLRLTIVEARAGQGADRATDLAVSEIEFWETD